MNSSKSKMKTVMLFLACMMVIGWSAKAFTQGPIPDIKLNGLDGPLVLSPTDTLTVSVGLSNDGRNDDADWWLAQTNPYGLFFLSVDGWLPEILPAYRGPLFNLPQVNLLRVPLAGLPLGTYTLYFGVDTPMDGAITWESLRLDQAEFGLADDADQPTKSVAKILGPLFMYYLDRYFTGIPDDSEIARGLASILDESPKGRELLMRTRKQLQETAE